jgi:hypothetical protein
MARHMLCSGCIRLGHGKRECRLWYSLLVFKEFNIFKKENSSLSGNGIA